MSSERGNTNLARERTSFVGRSDALANLERLFGEGSPLVTIVGAPGVGKTRLAQHYALAHLGEYEAGGVWFVDLTESHTADDVTGAVAAVIGAPQISQALAARGDALVILDNFEHLVAHAGETLGRWLEEAPEARFLVTSRERLRLEGEAAFELAPLPEESALELLQERAQTTSREISPDELAVSREIVRQLDRLPLAIELAAARFNVLSPRQLLDRLSQRFSLLESGRRDVPARLSTLRAAIDWSWELLSPIEQAALAQSTVFRGGYSIEAAEAVLDLGDDTNVLDVLQSLQDKSMLRSYEPAELPDELRFGLYESIRDYAGEKLEATTRAESEERHASYFVARAESWNDGINGPQTVKCARHLTIEYANIVGVQERFIESRPELAVRAVLALDHVMTTNGPFDTHIELLDRAVAAAERSGDVALRARSRLSRAETFVIRGRLREAREDLDHAERDATAISDNPVLGEAFVVRADVHRLTSQGPEAAYSCLDRALGIAKQSASRRLEATVLRMRGAHLELDGRFAESTEAKERSLDIYRSLGDRRMEAMVLTSLGRSFADEGELGLAELRLEESLRIHQELNNRLGRAIALTTLARIHHERGELDQARKRYEEAMAAQREVAVPRWECRALCNLALLEAEEGRTEEALELSARALSIARVLEEPALESIAWTRRAAFDALRGRVADAERALSLAEERIEREPGRRKAALEIYRGFIDLSRARAAFESADHAARDAQLALARCRHTRAIELGGEPLHSEARLSLRLLSREIERWEARHGAAPSLRPSAGVAADRSLEVGPEVRWFRVSGAAVIDLSRRHVMRRVLRALVAQYSKAPGEPLTLNDVFDAGWPGDVADRQAAANRVWVTLSLMRKLGLASVLVTHENGYLIDPRVRLITTQE